LWLWRNIARIVGRGCCYRCVIIPQRLIRGTSLLLLWLLLKLGRHIHAGVIGVAIITTSLRLLLRRGRQKLGRYALHDAVLVVAAVGGGGVVNCCDILLW